MRDPIEAFEWLLTAFRRYVRNEIIWLDVREVLREADALLDIYHDSPVEGE